MKAFLAACAAALVIALGAHFVLHSFDDSSATVYSSRDVDLQN